MRHATCQEPSYLIDRNVKVSMFPMRGRKIISKEEKEIDRLSAARLSALWNKYKMAHPDASQEMVAAELQMTQGAFWQY